MSTSLYDTPVSGEEQHCRWLDSQWEQEVVAQLPPDLEEQAFKYHAWRRKRAIKSPTDLLRALLAYVLCATSGRAPGGVGRAHWTGRYVRESLAQASAAGQCLAVVAVRRADQQSSPL